MKGNLYKYRKKKTHNFLGSCIFQMKKIFVINSIFLYRKLNPNSGLCHCFKSSVIALWNFPSFRVSRFVTSLEPPALTSYNLVLFSIYVNDGTTISRSSDIINIKQILLRKASFLVIHLLLLISENVHLHNFSNFSNF